MTDPDHQWDPDRTAGGVPPFPQRPPAVGPIYGHPRPDGAPPQYGDHPPYGGQQPYGDQPLYGDQPPYRDHQPYGSPRPPRRRGTAYRLIIAAGFLAGALLAGGVGVLVFDTIQDIVASQERGPELPVTGGVPLGEALDHSHDGIGVDWEAGPVLDEAGLDTGTRVEHAPGVILVDTRLLNGRGTGTGVVLTGGGLAVTNYHVVEDASEVAVTVADTGEVYQATVLGRDSLHDVAVLQIEDAPSLATVSINPEVPARGEPSAAVGNGGGQGYLTAVTGEVTGLDQSIVASSGVPEDSSRLTGLIETSSDVVPGYSGGPLVDGDGQVVGITTAASQGESAEEVRGYAIPVTTALGVVDQVLSGEETETVSIGVDGALGVVVGSEGGQAVIIEVSPGSSAERLGLREGDVVRAVNGQPVSGAVELSEIVNSHNVGDVIEVEWTTTAGEERSGEAVLQEAVVY